MRSSFAAILLLSLPEGARACLWDRDTLAQEAMGRMDVVETAVGWFDRFPPQYYEMRLARVTEELKSKPSQLDLYDDAAVAWERLGKQDEAISLMERKAKVMASLPADQTSEHRYRYLANIGTSYAHRWIKRPDHDREMGDLHKAIAFIEQALELNPNAHFGRERAQLILLQWFRDGFARPGKPASSDRFGGHGLDSINEIIRRVAKESPGFDLTKGLCGLVQLGAAWESVDVFVWRALSESGARSSATPHQNTAIAGIESARLADLLLDGKKPLYPDEDYQQELGNVCAEVFEMIPDARAREERQKKLSFALSRLTATYMMEEGSNVVNEFYLTANKGSEKRHAAKTKFMLERLVVGKHPDTDPAFWNGWIEPVMPQVPPGNWVEKMFGPSVARKFPKAVRTHLATAIVLSIIALGLLKVRWMLARARAAAK